MDIEDYIYKVRYLDFFWICLGISLSSSVIYSSTEYSSYQGYQTSYLRSRHNESNHTTLQGYTIELETKYIISQIYPPFSRNMWGAF